MSSAVESHRLLAIVYDCFHFAVQDKKSCHYHLILDFNHCVIYYYQLLLLGQCCDGGWEEFLHDFELLSCYFIYFRKVLVTLLLEMTILERMGCEAVFELLHCCKENLA